MDAKKGMHYTHVVNGSQELVWVESVLEAEVKSLSSVQSQIKKELQRQHAAERYQVSVDQLSDLSYAEAHGLSDTAKDLGVLTHSNLYVLGGPLPKGINNEIKLDSIVDQLKQTQSNSSLIQVGQESYVFFLDQYIPSQQLALARIKPEVKRSAIEAKKQAGKSSYRKTLLSSLQKAPTVAALKRLASQLDLHAEESQTISFSDAMTKDIFKLFASSSTHFAIAPSEADQALIYLATYSTSSSKAALEFPLLVGQYEFATSFSDWLKASKISLAQ